MAKDDDSDIDGAEDSELMSLFEETAFSLQKGTENRNMSAMPNNPGARRIIPKATNKTYTERLRSSLIALISIFLRPMLKQRGCNRIEKQTENHAFDTQR